MKRQPVFLVRALILATLLVGGIALAQDGELQSPAAPAEALGTSFTYQGRLDQNGSPVNDSCDMRFKLYDAASMGSQVGSTFTATVPVTEGLFTVTLDFGGRTFDGDRRWLGIEVDCEEDGTYADLGRQELAAAPYALYAMGVSWSGLDDVPAGFADGVDDDTTYTAGFGLFLGRDTFKVITSTIQQRVTGACGAGYAIRQVNADGSVVCEQDNDTTYTAGDGLVLNGTEFSVESNPCANVIVVAQSGGDYSSVQVAIDSITDATADNAYLIWIAPGVYNEAVTMKPHVHLQGAGQEVTVITSTVTSSSSSPTQATLVLTHHVSLRDLTVGNSGTGFHNVALSAMDGTTQTLVVDVTARAQGSGTYNYAVFLTGNDTGVFLQRITGLSEGSSFNNYGLYSDAGADAMLHVSSFTARGSFQTFGIWNKGSGTTLTATDVTILAQNGSGNNRSLHNSDGATAILRGGSFTARGGDDVYGIYNVSSDATLKATNVTVVAENGSADNYGLYNTGGAEVVLHGGSFTAREGTYTTRGISNIGSGTTLEATGVIALAENGSSNYGLYNDNGAEATLHGGSFTARGGGSTKGITNADNGTTLEATGVTALGENGSDLSIGLSNSLGAEAMLHGGSFTGHGGDDTYGIYNNSSGTMLEAEGITALGKNGSDCNRGLSNSQDAEAMLHGGFFIGRGGSQTWGISNYASTLKAEGITALGEGGSSNNYGIYNDISTAEVDSSRLTGSTYGLYLNSGTVRLGVTQVDGGVAKVSGTLTCFQVYDENYASYACP